MTSRAEHRYVKLGRVLLTGLAKAVVAGFTWAFGKLEVVAKVAGSISVLVGVIFGAIQYNRTTESKKVEQTFSYLRRFEDPGYIVDRQKIDEAFRHYADKIVEAAKDERSLDATIREMIVQEKIKESIDHVVYFYDELVYCVVSDYCEPKITYDLFYPKAREYYVNLFSYINLTRRQSAHGNFGSGLETLASFKRAAN